MCLFDRLFVRLVLNHFWRVFCYVSSMFLLCFCCVSAELWCFCYIYVVFLLCSCRVYVVFRFCFSSVTVQLFLCFFSVCVFCFCDGFVVRRIKLRKRTTLKTSRQGYYHWPSCNDNTKDLQATRMLTTGGFCVASLGSCACYSKRLWDDPSFSELVKTLKR